MRNRMLLLAVVALLLSLGVTYLAYRVFQNRLQPPEVTDNIVVAARNIALGARIEEDDVKLAKWPRSNPIEGGFNDESLVIGRAPMMPLQMNEPILETKLAPKEAGAGLTAIIPEGMRALSIQVNSIIGVAGFVLPGSRVDLILIAEPPAEIKGSRPGEQASKAILENLEVAAVGQNVQRTIDGKPQTVQVVTLLVTPEQAQKIALATGEGRIQLTLRNPMDKEAANPPLVNKPDLYTGSTMETEEGAAEPVEKPKPPPTAAPTAKRAPVRRAPVVRSPVIAPIAEPRTVVIEVIHGTDRDKKTMEETEAEKDAAEEAPAEKPLPQ